MKKLAKTVQKTIKNLGLELIINEKKELDTMFKKQHSELEKEYFALKKEFEKQKKGTEGQSFEYWANWWKDRYNETDKENINLSTKIETLELELGKYKLSPTNTRASKYKIVLEYLDLHPSDIYLMLKECMTLAEYYNQLLLTYTEIDVLSIGVSHFVGLMKRLTMNSDSGKCNID